ncbi:cupin domain-containing protein [Reinekea sp.]|uniref:cupin domain-containing protein n=1 Tax=Reinekea sp. TaxID=1970455 RepID=UPI00257C361B|nr:cupin domain-containing protein [Reinekea sp.]
MTRPSINIDADAFLSTYWQQSPQLLRQAFNPEQLISGDELAGLAMEPEVESRLIKHLPESDEWLLRHGPFAEEDFAELGPENWTLLVQAVDHWVPEIRTLLSGFNFLPQWRIDDIMVSFATKGGGVGPHFDQYDVFLLQVEGTREWRTGQLCDENSEINAQLPVKILTDFEEQDRWVLQPGDMLYIPPAFAHWGTALSDCLTVSVGFRAPAHSDLISDFGHFLASKVSDFNRYADPELANRSSAPHEIRPEDIVRLQTILHDYADNAALLTNWFGQYMTQPKYDDQAVETGDWAVEEFISHWLANPIYRNASSRLAYTDTVLFVDGQAMVTDLTPEQLNSLCDGDVFTHAAYAESEPMQKVLWSLINLGAVFFEG